MVPSQFNFEFWPREWSSHLAEVLTCSAFSKYQDFSKVLRHIGNIPRIPLLMTYFLTAIRSQLRMLERSITDFCTCTKFHIPGRLKCRHLQWLHDGVCLTLRCFRFFYVKQASLRPHRSTLDPFKMCFSYVHTTFGNCSLCFKYSCHIPVALNVDIHERWTQPELY